MKTFFNIFCLANCWLNINNECVLVRIKECDVKLTDHLVEANKANDEIEFLRTQRNSMESKLLALERELREKDIALKLEQRQKIQSDEECIDLKKEIR